MSQIEYPLSLALFDFVPVILTAIGFLYLVRLASSVLPVQGRIAFLGGSLIVAGGFFKAVWKLLMAASNSTIDIEWMDDGLFWFLVPGYSLFAWSMWQVARSVQGKQIFGAWLVPFVITAITFATSYSLFLSNPGSPAWERVLLTVTVLANFASGILLIMFAFRQQLSLAGWLFIINLLGVFLLNGLARISEQTIFIQWIDESVNSVSSLGFMLASRIVYEHMRASMNTDANIRARRKATVQGR